MPVGEVSESVIADSEKAILEYERFMYKTEFHQVTYVLDSYIRKASKYMAKAKSEADKSDDDALRRRYLIDTFHMIKNRRCSPSPSCSQRHRNGKGLHEPRRVRMELGSYF